MILGERKCSWRKMLVLEANWSFFTRIDFGDDELLVAGTSPINKHTIGCHSYQLDVDSIFLP